MTVKLHKYRLLFIFDGVWQVYETSQKPCRKIVEHATMIVPPGNYPEPVKDRIGMFSEYRVEELPDVSKIRERLHLKPGPFEEEES